MSYYSIKDLERLSGIKAHTLRIWERRYGILKPERTQTNIRLYSNQELKQLLNIAVLQKHGYKISKIADYEPEKLASEVIKLTEHPTDHQSQIDLLIIAMVEVDEDKFEFVLSNNILRMGFEETMCEIIYPFLRKIGVMWQAGAISPAQEHFISNLIRQKLIVAIDGQQRKKVDNSKSFILFLPEGELHEISLLFCYYLLKKAGKKVIYLGQSVPFEDLLKIVHSVNATHLISIFTSQLAEINPQQYIEKLCKEFPSHKLLLSGFQLMNPNLNPPKGVIIFKEPIEIISLLDNQKS